MILVGQRLQTFNTISLTVSKTGEIFQPVLSCYSLNIHFNLNLCWFLISRFSVKRLNMIVVLQHFEYRHTNSHNQNDKCITCVDLFQVTVIRVFRIIYLNFIGQIKLYKLFYGIFFSM